MGYQVRLGVGAHPLDVLREQTDLAGVAAAQGVRVNRMSSGVTVGGREPASACRSAGLSG